MKPKSFKKQLILCIFILALISVCFYSCSVIKNSSYAKNLESHNMVWDGLERTYHTYTPTSIDPSIKTPLLFHLHGGGGTGKGTPGLTLGRFNELAEKHKFIVVYPDAIEKNWNDGRSLEFVKAWEENIDDVGFIVNIVDKLKDSYKIAQDKVFTTGMSNGGFMTSRLVCDRPDIFKGAAILTATISKEYFESCKPNQQVPVMIMNGTEDPLIPYDGGDIFIFNKKRGSVLSTDNYVKFWVENNGCDASKTSINLPDLVDDGTSVKQHIYSNCKDGSKVEVFDIIGGGHTWPGGLQYLGEKVIGKTSKDINACDVIWNFFDTI